MKIKVLYFAALREKLGTPGGEIDVPAGIGTVDALRAHLAARGGDYGVLDAKTLVRMAVNQEMVLGSAAIQAGDEVAFFPPVTGG